MPVAIEVTVAKHGVTYFSVISDASPLREKVARTTIRAG
jgi:hypothetical protein